jgi:hypothetical protein
MRLLVTFVGGLGHHAPRFLADVGMRDRCRAVAEEMRGLPGSAAAVAALAGAARDA